VDRIIPPPPPPPPPPPVGVVEVKSPSPPPPPPSPPVVLVEKVSPPSPTLSPPLVVVDGMTPLLLLPLLLLLIILEKMSLPLPFLLVGKEAAVATTALKVAKTALKSLNYFGITRLRVAPAISLAGLNLGYPSSLPANISEFLTI
jgi:hypothetical protein